MTLPKPKHQQKPSTTSKAHKQQHEEDGGNSNNTTVIRPIVNQSHDPHDSRENETFSTLMNNAVASNPAREKLNKQVKVKVLNIV